MLKITPYVQILTWINILPNYQSGVQLCHARPAS